MPARHARLGHHNINWVTPEHVVPQLVESMPAAVAGGLRLPIVSSTSGYDELHCLALLDGIVDIYMPDFKLWTPERCRRHLKRADYAEVARAAIVEMHRQEILRFVAEQLGPGSYLNLMAQYCAAARVGHAGAYAELDRRPYCEEYARALSSAERLGLRRLDARGRLEGALLQAARTAPAVW